MRYRNTVQLGDDGVLWISRQRRSCIQELTSEFPVDRIVLTTQVHKLTSTTTQDLRSVAEGRER
jgi:hypothetical protein